MYTEDNTRMPREAIGDDLLLRMLDSTRSCCNVSNNNNSAANAKNKCGSANTDRGSGSSARLYQPQGGMCGSGNAKRDTFGLEDYPLASMYAPLQKFRCLYDKETALMNGTVFSELDLPFMGMSVTKGGCGCD